MADDFDPYYTWLGIPPKDQPPHHYRLLGLELFESNPDVIENAADRQMAHVRTVGSARHQDASQRVLNEIAAARICLLSQEKKTAYDGELRNRIAPKAAREVRRAAPLPDGDPAAPPVSAPPVPIPPGPGPPGSPPPGPVVRPLYSQDEPAGAAVSPLGFSLPNGSAADGSTPGVATGYSLAPQPSRSTPSRRPRPALVPIIGLGVALGLAVVVGLWFLLRGGQERDLLAQKSAGSSSQNGGSKKTDDSDTKSPIEGKSSLESKSPLESKTPDGKTSPIPGIKQPVEVPAVSAAELPRYALRFSDQARVELSNTADLFGLLNAYTVEVWVRPKSADVTHPIVGNLVVGKLHPDVADDEFLGWMLVTMKASATGVPVMVARGERGSGGRLPATVLGQWVHLAMTFEGERQVVYANGRRLSTAKIALPPASKSNLCLGVPPYGGEPNQVWFDGDICGLRVSNGVRYQQAFTPARQFAADAETLMLLDFNQQGSGEVRDLAGKNYHGRIVGATWIATSGGIAETVNNARAIDLLPLVDVTRDAVSGQWEQEEQGFKCDASRASRLMLPVVPQGDYELEVEFTRQGGNESINLILPVGARQVQLVLHGYPQRSVCAGLDMVDGEYAYRNPTTVAPFRLENGRRYRTTVKVARADGKATIEAHLDGTRLFTWTGAETSLSLLAAYQLPNRRCPGLMSYESAATFHAARLRMTSGQLAMLRKTSSPKPTPKETPKPKFSPGVASKPKPSRSAGPKGEALEAARRSVRDLFPDDVAGATTPAKKEALARKLLDRANERRDSRDRVYALLYEARETAIAGLDVETAVKASEQMAEGYDVDGAATLLDAFTRLSAVNLTVDRRRALLEAMLGAADHAADKEDFAAASELLALATKVLAKAGDADLRRKATFLKDQIEQTQTWFEEAQAARAVLADKPDDGAANRALGKYLCFVSDDWENGLPHLLKAGDAHADDATLKAAAALEQGPPDTPAKQVLAGDAWWDLAAPATGYWKTSLQKRAQHWYQKAVGDLKPPAQGIVEKRLATLEKTLSDTGASAGALGRRIIGDFFLVATGKKDARMTATMAFAADGTVSDNRSPVGRWAIEAGQVRLTFNDSARGSISLRSRGKDTFVGLAKSETPNWELKRVVVVAVWNVSVERASVADQRLTLYSNGKANDIYGNATWSLSGNNLSIDWPEHRGLGLGLRGVFRIEPGGKIFRSTEPRLRLVRGERVAVPDAG